MRSHSGSRWRRPQVDRQPPGWRRMRCKISNPMTTEQQLRERLRKIAALFEGATTVGERNAAAAAIDRVKRAIDTTSKVDTPVEYHFNLPDHWKRRLFSALCRRYGLEPYRYCWPRHTTVMVKVPKTFRGTTLLSG